MTKLGTITKVGFAIALCWVLLPLGILAAGGAPDIPHSISGEGNCLSCHGAGAVRPVPPSHADYQESACLLCHQAAPAVTSPAPAPVTAAADDTACLACHRQTDLSMTLASGEKLSLYVDAATFTASVHGGKLLCTDCHANITGFPHPAQNSSSLREYTGAQYEICARCHQAVFNQYRDSVHGKALLEGNYNDVPVCTDCHQSHTIADPRTASFRLQSVQLCAACHRNATLMAKYDISPNVVKSYLQDFHGRTVALVEKENKDIWAEEAVCTDCHGIHDIQMADSPGSPVIKANLVATCQKCHPDASTNFPSAWLAHYEPTLHQAPLVFIVQWFYRILIPFIIVGISIHIVLDIWKRVTDR